MGNKVCVVMVTAERFLKEHEERPRPYVPKRRRRAAPWAASRRREIN